MMQEDLAIIQNDYTRKIDDLYDAYTFAQENSLDEVNIANAHQLLSKHILDKQFQGREMRFFYFFNIG